jgi:glucose dehydrogenase
MEVSSKLQPPATLPTRIGALYQVDRRLGGPQTQLAMKKRKSLALARNRTLIIQPIT